MKVKWFIDWTIFFFLTLHEVYIGEPSALEDAYQDLPEEIDHVFIDLSFCCTFL